MNAADIKEELAALLADHAFVVWHDPAGTFAETAQGLSLPGVMVLIEDEHTGIELKRLLCTEMGARRILLYRQQARSIRDDWLADVESAAASFSADFASVLLRRLHAPDTAEMRACIEAHRALLAKRGTVTRLAALRHAYSHPRALELGLIAVSLSKTCPSLAPGELAPDTVAQACMELDLAGEMPRASAVLHADGVLETARDALCAWTGFTGDLARDGAFARHVILCAFGKTCGDTAQLPDATIGTPAQQRFCHGITLVCSRGDRRAELLDACCDTEQKCGIPGRIAGLELASLCKLDVLPCVDELIGDRLLRHAATGSDHPEDLLSILAERRSSMWHERTAHAFNAAEAALNMRRFQRDHLDGIPALDAGHLWSAYQSDYARMDTWYRTLMVTTLAQTRATENHRFDEGFRLCCDAMEHLYRDWFLKTLSRRWSDAIEDDLTHQGWVSSIPRQRDFFMSDVEGAGRRRKRTAVVISDALRFEVARELAAALERTTRGTCQLKAIQAELPSITPCGMSAALPASSYSLAPREGGHGFCVLAGGSERRSTVQRQEALRERVGSAVAIQYHDLADRLSRNERRALLDKSELVYIYHNTIDAIGDNAATERKVADACTDAIAELCALVSMLTREALCSRVIITADHGFLYTDRPLSEIDRLGAAEISGTIYELGRRYVICGEDAASAALMRVRLPHSRDDRGRKLVCLTPRECTRLKKPGGGENYVHGGTSLQEMCVPVLTFTDARSGSRGYEQLRGPGLSLVSTVDTVTNPEVSIELLQVEAVGGKVVPDTVELYVCDPSQRIVSSVARVVADRTDADAARRTLQATLSIRNGVGTSERERYQLMCRSERTGETSVLATLRIVLMASADDPWSW